MSTKSVPVIAEVTAAFKGGEKYSAEACFGGRSFEATSKSSAAAISKLATQLKRSAPDVTHLMLDGHLIPLGR